MGAVWEVHVERLCQNIDVVATSCQSDVFDLVTIYIKGIVYILAWGVLQPYKQRAGKGKQFSHCFRREDYYRNGYMYTGLFIAFEAV